VILKPDSCTLGHRLVPFGVRVVRVVEAAALRSFSLFFDLRLVIGLGIRICKNFLCLLDDLLLFIIFITVEVLFCSFGSLIGAFFNHFSVLVLVSINRELELPGDSLRFFFLYLLVLGGVLFLLIEKLLGA